MMRAGHENGVSGDMQDLCKTASDLLDSDPMRAMSL